MCVENVVAREHSVFSTGFNTCPPLFKVESKKIKEKQCFCLRIQITAASYGLYVQDNGLSLCFVL